MEELTYMTAVSDFFTGSIAAATLVWALAVVKFLVVDEAKREEN